VTIPSDLFLSPDLSEEDARGYLRALGFRDPEGTDRLLQAIREVARHLLANVQRMHADVRKELP